MVLTAGVIGVQGDVREHAAAFTRAAETAGAGRVEVIEIRQAGLVPECDMLALPGGESTTISRLLGREGIDAEIKHHVEAGKPLLATCAGLIVAARDAGDDRVDTLGVVDVVVDRNAFGRQRESFETHLRVEGISEPFPAVFIRAPVVTEVGAGVEVLAEFDGRIVAVHDPPVVGTAFHPELTAAAAIHDLAFFSENGDQSR